MFEFFRHQFVCPVLRIRSLFGIDSVHDSVGLVESSAELGAYIGVTYLYIDPYRTLRYEGWE
jgi:hypothetical protein